MKETKLNPNFAHRLAGLDEEPTAVNLSDSINTLALQADSLLALISNQFADPDERPVRMSDTIMFWSLESVRQTVNDMKVIVDAYHEAHRPAAEDAAA